jgi:hypothetical protein
VLAISWQNQLKSAASLFREFCKVRCESDHFMTKFVGRKPAVADLEEGGGDQHILGIGYVFVLASLKI